MSYKYSTGSVYRGDIYFEDDREGASTYIDFGQDTITLRPSGTAQLYVEDGKVGIGTTSPSDILHIQGNASTTRLQIENTAANGDPMLMLQTDGATNWYIGIDDSDADKLMFMSDGGAWDPAAAAVTFTTDGKVGIGTTNPTEVLTLNATDPTIRFEENGTFKATIGVNSSDNIVIENKTMNKHIVFKANDQGTIKEGLRLDGAIPEVVVNQQHESEGTLVDFRVESENNTHMLFVDGSADKVGVNNSTPGSGLHVNSSFATAIAAKSSDYTLTGADHTILVDCSSANVTLTLPTAVGCAGRMYIIKRVDASANAANINSNGSEEIEGSTSSASVASRGSIVLQSDNSGWWKVAEYINPP